MSSPSIFIKKRACPAHSKILPSPGPAFQAPSADKDCTHDKYDVGSRPNNNNNKYDVVGSHSAGTLSNFPP